jgi:nitrogen-specific signal transduction histidine kinase
MHLNSKLTIKQHKPTQKNIVNKIKSMPDFFNNRKSIFMLFYQQCLIPKHIPFSNNLQHKLLPLIQQPVHNKPINVSKIDNNLIIKIKDNGCGIKKENIDKIFQPFFSTKDKEKGIGIGLTTVKKIVEEDLYGKIYVYSEENNGTSLNIEIPHTIYKS